MRKKVWCLFDVFLSNETIYINFLMSSFSKPVSKLVRNFTNFKKSNWFYFLYWRSFRSAKTVVLFSRQNTELFGEYLFRRSHSELFHEKGVLEIFTKSGKHQCWSLLFNKVAGWKPPTLLKKGPRQKCCPLNFARFSRTPISWNTCKRLLLYTARLISVWSKVCSYSICCLFISFDYIRIRNKMAEMTD